MKKYKVMRVPDLYGTKGHGKLEQKMLDAIQAWVFAQIALHTRGKECQRNMDAAYALACVQVTKIRDAYAVAHGIDRGALRRLRKYFKVQETRELFTEIDRCGEILDSIAATQGILGREKRQR